MARITLIGCLLHPWARTYRAEESAHLLASFIPWSSTSWGPGEGVGVVGFWPLPPSKQPVFSDSVPGVAPLRLASELSPGPWASGTPVTTLASAFSLPGHLRAHCIVSAQPQPCPGMPGPPGQLCLLSSPHSLLTLAQNLSSANFCAGPVWHLLNLRNSPKSYF